MNQREIKIGESYLFFRTDVAHRKGMEGTIVKVIGQINGGKKKETMWSNCGGGNKPMRFKLDNGQYCNAGELKPQKQNAILSPSKTPEA